MDDKGLQLSDGVVTFSKGRGCVGADPFLPLAADFEQGMFDFNRAD